MWRLCVLVLLMVLPTAALAAPPAPPPGWTVTVANDGALLVAPAPDPAHRLALTLLPATQAGAPTESWFADQAVALAKSFGAPDGASQVATQGPILMRAVKVRNDQGLEIRAVFYGYPAARGFQIAVLMVPPMVADDDPRIGVAENYLKSLAAGGYAFTPPNTMAMPNLGPQTAGPGPQGGPIYQPRPLLGPGHDVPITGVYFMAGIVNGAVNAGINGSYYGPHAVQQLMLLYANGVAVKSDMKGDNLVGHHQSEGFATLDVTDPRVIGGAGFGHWTASGQAVQIAWNYAAPETLAKSGSNLEGPGEHWTPYKLMDGVRLQGLYVRRMEAGLRSQAIVLRQDGAFEADGVNVTLGGEIVMPQFPAQGSGAYQISKGSLILTFSNGFTVAIACTMNGNTLLLNNFPFVQEQ